MLYYRKYIPREQIKKGTKMRKLVTAASIATAALAATISSTNAQETGWQKDIKPLFDKQCAACHSSKSPEYAQFKKEKDRLVAQGIGMKMDSYSLIISYVGWPQTGAMMRRLDDGSSKQDKKPGNMYQYLGNSEEERQKNLTIFKQWVGSWNLKRWNEVTKEELNQLKVAY
jgi:hypothetical protein